MQVDWLISFVAVVDHGGFAAAANGTFRAQSRVSAHISALEREVGVQLFDRRSRPVALTQSGEAYLTHARAVLGQLELGRNAVAEISGMVRGQIAIAAHPSAAATFLPRVIQDFGRRYPGIHIDLVEEFAQVNDALLTGRVQLGLRPLYPASSDARLRRVALWREPMRVVVHPQHPLAVRGAAVEPADLARYDLVVPGHSFSQTEAFQLLTQRGVTPKVGYLTNVPQTLIALVRSDLGVGFTNELAVASCVTDGVRVLPLADTTLVREVSVVFEASQAGLITANPFWKTLMATRLPRGAIDARIHAGGSVAVSDISDRQHPDPVQLRPRSMSRRATPPRALPSMTA
ncbi:LysR family transcriptional regulator [Acrocarpospora catenulata]|uniref:LysR family transcriptional regulator n=1 Tax=Acrocarpospora catenulata TaxID=2836182 RepID=UPI001BD9AF49|nr:LysR family transcriptional regulator [Acrocarpospora catenulata]